MQKLKFKLHYIPEEYQYDEWDKEMVYMHYRFDSPIHLLSQLYSALNRIKLTHDHGCR